MLLYTVKLFEQPLSFYCFLLTLNSTKFMFEFYIYFYSCDKLLFVGTATIGFSQLKIYCFALATFFLNANQEWNSKIFFIFSTFGWNFFWYIVINHLDHAQFTDFEWILSLLLDWERFNIT